MAAPSVGAGGGGVGAGEGSSSSAAATIGAHSVDQVAEAMWKMNLGEAVELGPYPERVGEPDCSYYMRTGMCRFGMTCKFNHPADRKLAVAAARMKGEYPQRNGQPECQNEKECAYYLRTGQCKFGSTCKFHHPQPSTMMVAAQIGSSSSDDQQRTPGAAQYYTGSRQSGTAGMGDQGMFSSYQAGSLPVGLYAVQRENVFPERPDQPECQFYMKTGDCKFGAVCKFHHPRERIIPSPNCALSSLGLPLRPGEPICSFYSRYGMCKFGPNCKFDHPTGTVMYGHASSPTSEVPTSRRMLAHVASHPEVSPDNGSGRSRRITHSDSQQIPSGERSTEREAS
ncbi:Zinc finger CCCH domain-containing protein 63 [Dichanthelium oligosanthes]|uniref:Zinc finger CCCH domain-containing protein 63 n=1 Tax=Dichanthelium oligosanthes TaxID=888268 RepID=A0A1E5UQ06_9POAL|nr:Zinc finger CCCH domain-containing protein 63 [Dichanthelium oligosanthes]